MTPLPVWIDTDPAYGEPLRDTDDVLALLQAFRSPELDVRGISIVHGNPRRFDRSVERTRNLAKEHAPHAIPVHPGARSATDFGRRTEAAEALEAALEACPLTILAIGPLTTVATVLSSRPDLHEQVREVVTVAGRRPGQPLRPNGGLVPRGALLTLRDMNFEHDVEAFCALLDADVPLTLVPYEACETVWLGAEAIRTLHVSGALPDWLTRRSRSWLSLWVHVVGLDAFFPFDCLAVGHLTSPHLFRYERGQAARIEWAPDDGLFRWRTKPYLVVDEGKGRAVTYCTGATPAFKDGLLARLDQTLHAAA
jgi:inosine-uridine nucleoside N-ribohydrolase